MIPTNNPVRAVWRDICSPWGYTLIELLTGLSLLGVVFAISVPCLVSMPYWRLETATRRLAADFRLLRHESINSGKECRADFYVDIGRYYLYLPEGSMHINLPEGVTFVGTTTFTGKPPSVNFNYLGHPGPGGTVILKTGEIYRYVIVAPVTGRVRVSRDPPTHWQAG